MQHSEKLIYILELQIYVCEIQKTGNCVWPMTNDKERLLNWRLLMFSKFFLFICFFVCFGGGGGGIAGEKGKKEILFFLWIT